MRKVINCAHRGAMAYEPENTLRAFRAAADMGADQVELDVFLSADEELIVNHGSRLHTEPHGGKIRLMTLEQIKEERFQGEPVPTLQQAVDLCKATGMTVNIEIKDGRAVDKTVELIRDNALYDSCQVSCFFLRVLKRAKQLDPAVPTGYIVVPYLQWPQMRRAVRAGCESVNPLHKTTNEKFLAAAHGRGLKVHVWTVNEPGDLRRMIDLGVDGIITNKPDVLTREKKAAGVE